MTSTLFRPLLIGAAVLALGGCNKPAETSGNTASAVNGAATAKGHETAATKNCDAQAPSNEKPPGEWNTLEVECSGDAIKLWTNGKLMNQITGCSVSSGAVGIQSEGGDIEVRRMYLEPLKQ